MTALLVVLGAMVGAPLRHAWAVSLRRRAGPWARCWSTRWARGSFGLFAALSLSDEAWALLGSGFCGAFTTFSALAVQAVDRPPRDAAPYVLATVVLAVGACLLGWQLGTAL